MFRKRIDNSRIAVSVTLNFRRDAALAENYDNSCRLISTMLMANALPVEVTDKCL